MKSNLSEIFAS